MSELVSITIDAGVADVRLNRPEKYNALSRDMFQAIIAAGESLSQNNSVRAVVLSGNGPGFCAGLDFENFRSLGSGSGASLLNKDENRTENNAQRPAYVWKRMPVPVIAAIHGVAYGGGIQIALGADVRIATPEARLSVMEIKWGLIPDMSLTQTLRDLVPLDVAKELTFTGRIFSGEEALSMGLVTRLDEDPLAAALKLAREIASKSPHAIRAGKQLLESAWHSDEAAGLALEAALQTELIGSPNQVEAVQANFAKRAPEFVDPGA